MPPWELVLPEEIWRQVFHLVLDSETLCRFSLTSRKNLNHTFKYAHWALLEPRCGGLSLLPKLLRAGCLEALELIQLPELNDWHLSSLVALTTLRKLFITDCPSITAAGIASLQYLTTLDLLALEGLVPTACERVAELSTLRRLKQLLIGSSPSEGYHICHVSDEQLGALLSSISSLEALELYNCPSVSDWAVSQISKMSQLGTLTLFGLENVKTPWLAISCCTRLSRLALGQMSPQSETFSLISRLTQLTKLYIDDIPALDSDSLLSLRGLSLLEELNLHYLDMNDDRYMACMQGMRNLRSLSLIHVGEADASTMATLASMELLKLTALVLQALEVDDVWMERISLISTIKHLELTDQSCFGRVGASHICRLRDLHTLVVAYNGNFDDECLATVASQLPELRDLELTGTIISDYGLVESSAHLSRLTSIVLNELPALTDSGLRALGKMRELQYLGLRSCRGLSPMASKMIVAFAPKLKFVDLSGCQWLDANSRCELLQLKNMIKLEISDPAEMETRLQQEKKPCCVTM